MHNSAIKRSGARTVLLCVAFGASVTAQTQPPHVSVWLMPVENAAPNDIAQGEKIPAQLDALRASLAKTRVRLLNVEDPLAMKARSWNPEFNVPNFQVVTSQRKTLAALQRFAERYRVDVVVRFVTWDEAFGLLNADRASGPDALPDIAQIGTSWRGYFAAKHRILSRPNWQSSRGNWRDVLGIPACSLPYTNDVRLLFYWKRLPSLPEAPQLQLKNGDSWQAVLNSLRDGTGVGDTMAFATGVTLNLLHDYASLVWAGPAPRLVTPHAFGSSIDLVSEGAMNVPSYLARHARIPFGNGDYRRLISFPESSHEEVSRTFVNGGYRATLEPANFIGRWAEDFEERQQKRNQEGKPRQRFWDYAAAIVPPGSFKGGSELVVSATARAPELAFTLADFLATDSQYTEVLAQAGQLPSGRPGYGIDALATSLASRGTESDVQAFSEAVQKAIDQGHQYPDLKEWPIVVENRTVLEALQRVWRRMAEGDVEAMHQAASDVQWEINSRIYWFDRVWNALAESWLLLLIVALLLGGYAGRGYWQRSRSLRRLITLLHLYRASRHESAKILGDNLLGLVAQRESGELACEQLEQRLSEVAHHYTDKLVPYMGKLGEELVDQIQEGSRATSTLSAVVDDAATGAKLHYEAVRLIALPDVVFASVGLDSWVVYRYPALAKVILQEWFFNCLRTLRNGSTPVTVGVENRVLTVRSGGQLSEIDFETITGKPSSGKLNADAHGLVLIRDITYYAFGRRVRVEQGGGSIRLSVRLPLARHKKRQNG